MAPVFLAIVWYGNPYFEGCVILIALIGAFELQQIAYKKRTQGIVFSLLVLFLLSLIALILNHSLIAGITILLTVTIASCVCEKENGNRFWGSIGMLYIFVAVISLGMIRDLEPDGQKWIFWFFAVVWSSDIGAYLLGKTIGGPKLAPYISPGKTWSGAVGGLIVAIATSAVLSVSLLPDQHILDMMLFALFTGVASQIGDLIESYFKRCNNVKDTGKLIPGHGGVLDRIDGVLFAAPLACVVIPYVTEAVN